jgi:hypothetical protein
MQGCQGLQRSAVRLAQESSAEGGEERGAI